MKKPSQPRPRTPQPLRTLDDRALERVRGGTQSAPPPAITSLDDWEAPVV